MHATFVINDTSFNVFFAANSEAVKGQQKHPLITFGVNRLDSFEEKPY